MHCVSCECVHTAQRVAATTARRLQSRRDHAAAHSGRAIAGKAPVEHRGGHSVSHSSGRSI
eukprot:8927607-Lingulodinium_polyedra.AAC.1